VACGAVLRCLRAHGRECTRRRGDLASADAPRPARRSQRRRDSVRAVLDARMNGKNGDDGEHCEPPRVARAEQTTALAVERLALGSLRIVLVLTVLSALSDTVLAALDRADVPLLLAGAAIADLALAGVLSGGGTCEG
jgi:hypothetical protein